MRMPSGLLLPFALSVVLALFLAPPVQADERVKLTGDEIEEILFTPGNVIFGVDHRNNVVWIGTALGDGDRHFYWRSLARGYPRTQTPPTPPPATQGPVSGEFTGTVRIVNDQQCAIGYAEDRCLDLYRIGKNKYESWAGETLQSTWYRAN